MITSLDTLNFPRLFIGYCVDCRSNATVKRIRRLLGHMRHTVF